MKSCFCFLLAIGLAVAATGTAQERRLAAAGSNRASPSASPAKKGAKGTTNGNDLFGTGQESKGPTEITAHEQAQFDAQSRSAVFTGNVKVVDPQFTMTADKLTVHLNRDDEGGGLQTAEAEGHVIIVHLNEPKPAAGTTPVPGGSPAPPAGPPVPPVRSTGKAERAIYEAKDGSVTLLGWPEVTQGLNSHIAIEPGVKMVIYRDGRMKTYGSTRTIIQEKTEPNKAQTNAAQ